MTTHTPGPWEAIDRDGIGIDDNVIGPNNEQIARVYAIDTDSGNSNWQLITAAPALLEAAEAAVAALTQPATFPADINAAVLWLTNAIAAAKGGAQ